MKFPSALFETAKYGVFRCAFCIWFFTPNFAAFVQHICALLRLYFECLLLLLVFFPLQFFFAFSFDFCAWKITSDVSNTLVLFSFCYRCSSDFHISNALVLFSHMEFGQPKYVTGICPYFFFHFHFYYSVLQLIYSADSNRLLYLCYDSRKKRYEYTSFKFLVSNDFDIFEIRNF